MSAHTISFETLPKGPIDLPLAVGALSLAYSAETDQFAGEPSAYGELGGSATTLDERFRYLPFAAEFQADPRKIEIERGLAGLGLLVVTRQSILNFQSGGLRYVAAAFNYQAQLGSKARMLRTPGQIEGMQNVYPDTTEDWAQQYAEMLDELSRTFVESDVFEALTELKKVNELTVNKLKKRVPHPKIGVIFDEAHRLKVVDLGTLSTARKSA